MSDSSTSGKSNIILISERLKNAQMTSDRLDCLEQLTRLSSSSSHFIVSYATDPLIRLMKLQPYDPGVIYSIIELFISILSPEVESKSHVEDSKKIVDSLLADLTIMNALFRFMTNSPERLKTSVLQLLLILSKQEPTKTTSLIERCSGGIGKLMELLDDKSDSVRSELLVLLVSLTQMSPAFATFIAFNDGFDKFFRAILQHLAPPRGLPEPASLSSLALVYDCLCIVSNCLRFQVSQRLFLEGKNLPQLYLTISRLMFSSMDVQGVSAEHSSAIDLEAASKASKQRARAEKALVKALEPLSVLLSPLEKFAFPARSGGASPVSEPTSPAEEVWPRLAERCSSSGDYFRAILHASEAIISKKPTDGGVQDAREAAEALCRDSPALLGLLSQLALGAHALSPVSMRVRNLSLRLLCSIAALAPAGFRGAPLTVVGCPFVAERPPALSHAVNLPNGQRESRSSVNSLKSSAERRDKGSASALIKHLIDDSVPDLFIDDPCAFLGSFEPRSDVGGPVPVDCGDIISPKPTLSSKSKYGQRANDHLLTPLPVALAAALTYQPVPRAPEPSVDISATGPRGKFWTNAMMTLQLAAGIQLLSGALLLLLTGADEPSRVSSAMFARAAPPSSVSRIFDSFRVHSPSNANAEVLEGSSTPRSQRERTEGRALSDALQSCFVMSMATSPTAKEFLSSSNADLSGTENHVVVILRFLCSLKGLHMYPLLEQLPGSADAQEAVESPLLAGAAGASSLLTLLLSPALCGLDANFDRNALFQADQTVQALLSAAQIPLGGAAGVLKDPLQALLAVFSDNVGLLGSDSAPTTEVLPLVLLRPALAAVALPDRARSFFASPAGALLPRVLASLRQRQNHTHSLSQDYWRRFPAAAVSLLLLFAFNVLSEAEKGSTDSSVTSGALLSAFDVCGGVSALLSDVQFLSDFSRAGNLSSVLLLSGGEHPQLICAVGASCLLDQPLQRLCDALMAQTASTLMASYASPTGESSHPSSNLHHLLELAQSRERRLAELEQELQVLREAAGDPLALTRAAAASSQLESKCSDLERVLEEERSRRSQVETEAAELLAALGAEKELRSELEAAARNSNAPPADSAPSVSMTEDERAQWQSAVAERDAYISTQYSHCQELERRVQELEQRLQEKEQQQPSTQDPQETSEAAERLALLLAVKDEQLDMLHQSLVELSLEDDVWAEPARFAAESELDLIQEFEEKLKNRASITSSSTSTDSSSKTSSVDLSNYVEKHVFEALQDSQRNLLEQLNNVQQELFAQQQLFASQQLHSDISQSQNERIQYLEATIIDLREQLAFQQNESNSRQELLDRINSEHQGQLQQLQQRELELAEQENALNQKELLLLQKEDSLLQQEQQLRQQEQQLKQQEQFQSSVPSTPLLRASSGSSYPYPTSTTRNVSLNGTGMGVGGNGVLSTPQLIDVELPPASPNSPQQQRGPEDALSRSLSHFISSNISEDSGLGGSKATSDLPRFEDLIKQLREVAAVELEQENLRKNEKAKEKEKEKGIIHARSTSSVSRIDASPTQTVSSTSFDNHNRSPDTGNRNLASSSENGAGILKENENESTSFTDFSGLGSSMFASSIFDVDYGVSNPAGDNASSTASEPQNTWNTTMSGNGNSNNQEGPASVFSQSPIRTSPLQEHQHSQSGYAGSNQGSHSSQTSESGHGLNVFESAVTSPTEVSYANNTSATSLSKNSHSDASAMSQLHPSSTVAPTHPTQFSSNLPAEADSPPVALWTGSSVSGTVDMYTDVPNESSSASSHVEPQRREELHENRESEPSEEAKPFPLFRLFKSAATTAIRSIPPSIVNQTMSTVEQLQRRNSSSKSEVHYRNQLQDVSQRVEINHQSEWEMTVPQPNQSENPVAASDSMGSSSINSGAYSYNNAVEQSGNNTFPHGTEEEHYQQADVQSVESGTEPSFSVGSFMSALTSVASRAAAVSNASQSKALFSSLANSFLTSQAEEPDQSVYNGNIQSSHGEPLFSGTDVAALLESSKFDGNVEPQELNNLSGSNKVSIPPFGAFNSNTSTTAASYFASHNDQQPFVNANTSGIQNDNNIPVTSASRADNQGVFSGSNHDNSAVSAADIFATGGSSRLPTEGPANNMSASYFFTNPTQNTNSLNPGSSSIGQPTQFPHSSQYDQSTHRVSRPVDSVGTHNTSDLRTVPSAPSANNFNPSGQNYTSNASFGSEGGLMGHGSSNVTHLASGPTTTMPFFNPTLPQKKSSGSSYNKYAAPSYTSYTH